MNTIQVNTSQPYPVYIGSGILADAGALICKHLKPVKLLIVSDNTVYRLYGKALTQTLLDCNIQVYAFTFPAGEESKNVDTYLNILNYLANNHFTRSDMIVALGGGVTGDISGFAAATYLRGIPYVQVPTSLLAMVDSSVGGKTAIDLPAGKNLAGAFYQPALVICDTSVLSTLPDDIFSDGCAEIIKYAVLYDEALYQHLWEKGLSFDRIYVISRCVALKRDVVTLDEFDNGARMLLNFGHTIGHGIEAASDYTVSHGQAVAAGMAIVTKACAKRNICTIQLYEGLCSLLSAFHLPYTTSYNAEQIYQKALSDKKRRADTVQIIVAQRIGSCCQYPVEVTKLKSFIEEGL